MNGWIWCSLGRGSLLLGRVGEAHRLGRLAVESASGRVDFVPDALQLLGDVAAHPDVFDAKEAEAYYGQGLALAETRRMQPLVAHCRVGLGRIRARVGRLEEAAAYLAAATAMYRALDMRGWLAQAEAESRNIA